MHRVAEDFPWPSVEVSEEKKQEALQQGKEILEAIDRDHDETMEAVRQLIAQMQQTPDVTAEIATEATDVRAEVTKSGVFELA